MTNILNNWLSKDYTTCIYYRDTSLLLLYYDNVENTQLCEIYTMYLSCLTLVDVVPLIDLIFLLLVLMDPLSFLLDLCVIT